MTDRPSWDDTWYVQAVAMQERARCVRRRIGAVIVSADERVLSSGYAGPPRALVTTDERCDMFCPRAQPDAKPGTGYGDCYTVHAEANALMRANWTEMQGGTLYVTSVPCWECAKLLSNSPLLRVVSHNDVASVQFRDPVRSIELMRDCGLEVILRG